MYYKNKENKPYFEPSQYIIERDELVEITKKEFDDIVYEINNPPLTEEQRVQNIKLTAQSLILQKYPLEKQSSANLGLYGEEYLAEMKAYISNMIRINNEAELNGTKVEDIQWQ